VLPWVILHNAISLDGRLTGFNADISKYYEITAIFKEDATLVGSNTILNEVTSSHLLVGIGPALADAGPIRVLGQGGAQD
jgi:riboflavin biosynthesis pyrimidine reductase